MTTSQLLDLTDVAADGVEPVLRPRTLVTQLFADALADDDNAEDDLRWLAVTRDPDAEVAYEALVVVASHRRPRLRA